MHNSSPAQIQVFLWETKDYDYKPRYDPKINYSKAENALAMVAHDEMRKLLTKNFKLDLS